MTSAGLASAFEQAAAELEALMQQGLTEAEKTEIKHVRLTGGATKLQPLAIAVQNAFPDAELRQCDPDKCVVREIAIDARCCVG
jgi:molecular chaperone DnaK (HSP70)